MRQANRRRIAQHGGTLMDSGNTILEGLDTVVRGRIVASLLTPEPELAPLPPLNPTATEPV